MRIPQFIAVAWLVLMCALAPVRVAQAQPAEPAVPAGYPCAGPVTASFPSRCAAPLTVAQERGLKQGNVFRECDTCPEMVVVPAGLFTMGSPKEEEGRLSDDEGPQHVVTIGKPFAVGKFHVTRDEYAAFVQETGYASSTTCYKQGWLMARSRICAEGSASRGLRDLGRCKGLRAKNRNDTRDGNLHRERGKPHRR